MKLLGSVGRGMVVCWESEVYVKVVLVAVMGASRDVYVNLSMYSESVSVYYDDEMVLLVLIFDDLLLEEMLFYVEMLKWKLEIGFMFSVAANRK